MKMENTVGHDPRVGVYTFPGKSVTRLASSEFHAFLEVLRRRSIFFYETTWAYLSSKKNLDSIGCLTAEINSLKVDHMTQKEGAIDFP